MEKNKNYIKVLMMMLLFVSINLFISNNVYAYSASANKLNTNYSLNGNGAEDIYAVAKAQLNKKYPEFAGFTYRAWCADFVSACAAAAGVSDVVPGTAAVANLRSNIVKAGGTEYSKTQIQNGYYTPVRGDIIIFKSNGDSHVGIVDKAENGKIYYIDGNNTVYGNGNNASVHYSNCAYSYAGFTCIVKPKYKTPTPVPPESAVNIGTNFYAYLINTATWLHATNDNSGNVSVRKLKYTSDQIWYFERQNDGSYKITSCKDGRCMEVHNFESTNGTNVEMNNWSGNTAQRWYIYGSSGQYKLKAACGNNALDMYGGEEAAQDGTNLNMWEDNGTSAQRYSIWVLDSPNLGITTPSVHSYGDSQGNNIKISWDACNDATGYDVRIFDERGERVVQTFWNVQGTSCVAKLEGGNYQVKVYTLNSRFNTWRERGKRSFTCSNNIGLDFYAYLINTATWLHVTNDSGNVNVKPLENTPRQIWHFVRQNDGSYKITSVEDGRCMEVHNFESANGTNVEMNNWSGNTAQRWYIYGSSGQYKLKAACGNNALDMYGGKEAAKDGTNLNMWEDNETSAQKFSIWVLDKVNVGTLMDKYTEKVEKPSLNKKVAQTLTAVIDNYNISIGETAQIKVTGQGKITYQSNDEDTVSVSSTGVVTGKKSGIATITVFAAGTQDYYSAQKKIIVNVLQESVEHQHTWDDGKITTEASYTENGVKTYTCCKCGATRIENIAKLEQQGLAPGKIIIDKSTNGVYKVLKDGFSVEFTKPMSKTASIIIPDVIKVNDIACKVTGISANALKNNKSLKTVTIGKNVATIGANAFYGCKKLRTITIKTCMLSSKTVGTKAFSGTYSKVIIRVPEEQLEKYKKIFKAKGMSSKAVYMK